MSSRRRKQADIEPHLTSLIDVTFLLIVFFVLVSHVNEVESVELDLPKPNQPATLLPEAETQVAISVIPAPDGRAEGYRIGDRMFAIDKPGLDSLSAHLASLYRLSPQTNVNIRADRTTQYEFVEPALRAVSIAARSVSSELPAAVNPRVNLMVVKD